MSEALSETDAAVIELLASRLTEPSDPPRMRLAVRASAIAVDRWGRDLERDAPEQRYGAFEQALAESATDVLDHYSTEEAEIEGVEAPVFEGRAISEDDLTELARELTAVIEHKSDPFDRHTPGGLVEESDV